MHLPAASALYQTGACVQLIERALAQVLRYLADTASAPHTTAGASPSFYSVALDPLDASTIIDANFAVGTIFAIWESNTLVNVTGRLVAF